MKYAWYALAALMLADFLAWALTDRREHDYPGPGVPPLYQAIADGDLERVKALATKENVRKDEKPYGTPLVFAARFGRPKTIGALIEAGADARDRSMPFGRTALGYTVAKGDFEGTRALLLGGADPNVPCDSEGGVPLGYIGRNVFPEVWNLLNQSGAKSAFSERRLQTDHRRQAESGRQIRELLLSHGGRDGS